MKDFMKIIAAMGLLACGNVLADTKIGVFDMQLLDLTMKMSDPQKNAERAAEDQKNLDTFVAHEPGHQRLGICRDDAEQIIGRIGGGFLAPEIARRENRNSAYCQDGDEVQHITF